MTDNPITFKLIKERIASKIRPLKMKYDFVFDEIQMWNTSIKQIGIQSFRISHHDLASQWIKDSGYEHQFITENPIAAVYTVTFTRAADAVHFKLVWC